jgi:plastocyanin
MRWLILPVLLLSASGAAPAAPPAAPVVVQMKDFKYDPALVTIVTGTAVRFVNDDQVAHSVTASDKSFDSGDFDAGKSWTHVFDKPGTYAYYCDVHAFMKGTVVVTDPKPE